MTGRQALSTAEGRAVRDTGRQLIEGTSVRNGWATKTLADVCRFSNGLWKGEKPPFANVGVVRNTNFTKGGTLDYSDIAYLDVEASKLEKRRLQFGDIILEKSGGGPKQPVGRVALFDRQDGDFSFSNFTASLRVLAPDEIDFRFLHRFLYWTYVSGATEGMQSHSTGIRNLNADAYRAIEFGYPPIPEQQRIVGVLDEAFAAIAAARANTEQNLRNAHDLFQSHLNAVFTRRGEGWVESKLGSITTKIGSGATPRGGEDSYKSEGISLIRSLNVHDLGFKNTRLAFLDSGQADDLANVDVKPRDVLLNITGASVARCCVVPDDVLPARVNQHVSIIRPNSGTLDAGFLHYMLISEPYKKQLLQTGVEGGSTRQAITKADIQGFTVGYPATLGEQAAFVAKLDAVLTETQRLASIYQRKLAALDALKQSLLHQAFTGAL